MCAIYLLYGCHQDELVKCNSHVLNFSVGFFIYVEINLQCWAVRGPFSTLWALTSTEGEEAGAEFCNGGGPASLETVLLLVVANVWLALWPSRGPLSCSGVLMSEAGVCLGAFRDPKPEPRTEDCKYERSKTRTKYIHARSGWSYIKKYVGACTCGCLYQCSMRVGGTSRGGMSVGVGCGMCVAVCCSATIVVRIGKHQALA